MSASQLDMFASQLDMFAWLVLSASGSPPARRARLLRLRRGGSLPRHRHEPAGGGERRPPQPLGLQGRRLHLAAQVPRGARCGSREGQGSLVRLSGGLGFPGAALGRVTGSLARLSGGSGFPGAALGRVRAAALGRVRVCRKRVHARSVPSRAARHAGSLADPLSSARCCKNALRTRGRVLYGSRRNSNDCVDFVMLPATIPPQPPASGWSLVRIYSRFLHL
eukprot:677717-Prorocentrum_minimum.AAC.1